MRQTYFKIFLCRSWSMMRCCRTRALSRQDSTNKWNNMPFGW